MRTTEVDIQRIYFAFTLLLRFNLQNSEALRHLVSKVESRSHQHLMPSVSYFTRFQFFVPLGGIHPIASMLDWIESEYIMLIGGDKKAAARELHVAEDDEHSNAVSTARLYNAGMAGLCLGVAVTCIVILLIVSSVLETAIPITTFNNSTNIPTSLLAVLGVLAMFAVLFSINVVAWDAYGIHYAYILQLDDRFHWDGLEMLRCSSRYAAAWGVAFVIAQDRSALGVTSEVSENVPYALLVLFGVMLLYDVITINIASAFFKTIPMLPKQWKRHATHATKPLNNPSTHPEREGDVEPLSPVIASLNRTNRRTVVADVFRTSWFGKTFLRIISAPLTTVVFSDFFLADQLTSISSLFGQIQSIIVWSITGYPNSWPIAASLPHVWRLLQCLRRYADQPTRTALHPNVSNAFKYACGIAQLVASWRFDVAYKAEVERNGGDAGAVDWSSLRVPLALWIFTACVDLIVKLGWDFYMDAGFLQKGFDKDCIFSSFLRNKRMYPLPTYWLFVLMNIAMRLVTIVRIGLIRKNSQGAKINAAIWWSIEVVRRFGWNFFRMEHEQINNMECYRAVDVVPPKWTVAEQNVLSGVKGSLSELDEELFDVLWGTAASKSELPPLINLFRRLPLSSQRAAVYAMQLVHASDTPTTVEWNVQAGHMDLYFSKLHCEDQLRLIFFAIGRTPLSIFLQRHAHPIP